MMKQKIFISIALFLLVPGIAFTQLKTQNPQDVHFPSALTKGYGQASGLFGFLGLDPSKIQMTHSYTLSFMTFGGQGFGQGVYLNTISYRISAPLSMSVQWGMLHQPFESAGVDSPFKSGFFVSGANLNYKPSNNFHVGIQYSSYPTTGYYRSPFDYGYRPNSLIRANEENQ